MLYPLALACAEPFGYAQDRHSRRAQGTVGDFHSPGVEIRSSGNHRFITTPGYQSPYIPQMIRKLVDAYIILPEIDSQTAGVTVHFRMPKNDSCFRILLMLLSLYVLFTKKIFKNNYPRVTNAT